MTDLSSQCPQQLVLGLFMDEASAQTAPRKLSLGQINTRLRSRLRPFEVLDVIYYLKKNNLVSGSGSDFEITSAGEAHYRQAVNKRSRE